MMLRFHTHSCFCASIILAFTLGVSYPAEHVYSQAKPTSPKMETEELMNVLLPHAEEMLSKYGEFYPYGGTMAKDGKISVQVGYDGRDQPPSQVLIDLLTATFQKTAKQQEIKASAIVSDVRAIPPGSTNKTDAIAVALDHVENYSVVVYLPYTVSITRQVRIGKPWASPGARNIFSK